MNDPRPTPPDHQGLLEQAMEHAETGGGRAAAEPMTPAELAGRFPEHDVHELIGRGGMGAVYRATQRTLQRQVAIKVLAPELAADPEFGERFLREARALAALTHPSILVVHDFGERDGLFYLITEFVDGVNLRQLMELGELSPAEALRIAPQICTALQFAHEHGVVHRDIKPENILIDTKGQVKIADFGLAKLAANAEDPVELTRRTAVLGTPHYMAPEQWRGQSARVDHRADIYSLGVVLYEMLTGQLPIGHFDPPSRRGGVPRGLDQVVQRALAQQPENRYQNAGDVRADVEREARGLKPGTAAKASARAAARAARRVRGPWVALAAVVAAAVAIGFLIFTVEQNRRGVYRFENAMRRYDAAASAAVVELRAGRAINYQEELPVSPEPHLLTIEVARWMVAAVGVGTLLLVLALGWSSLRRVRNGGGAVGGLAPAVVTAWAVPLGLADALAFSPIALLRGGDTQVLAGLAFGSLLAAGTVWFLVWQVRRQRAALATGAPMTRGRGWTTAAAVLCAALFAAAAALPLVFPFDPAVFRISRGPAFPTDLVGASKQRVLDRLGPPETTMVAADSVSWVYDDPDGEAVEHALVFSGDRVLASEPTGTVLMPNDDPAPGPQVGAPVEDFVAEFGAPVRRSAGNLATSWEFANGVTVLVRDGEVVGRSR